MKRKLKGCQETTQISIIYYNSPTKRAKRTHFDMRKNTTISIVVKHTNNIFKIINHTHEQKLKGT